VYYEVASFPAILELLVCFLRALLLRVLVFSSSSAGEEEEVHYSQLGAWHGALKEGDWDDESSASFHQHKNHQGSCRQSRCHQQPVVVKSEEAQM
jgi:hypothetical protein